MSVLPAFASVERVVSERAEPRLEQIACPLCRSIKHEPLLRACDPNGGTEEFQVVRCTGCDLRFTNPRPTVDAIGRHYDHDYAPHARPVRLNRPLRGWYPHDWLAKPAGAARLLDVGCGAGQFLTTMRDRDWTATGIDVSNAMADGGQRGFRVHCGTLPHPALAERSFELITMWHTLEHVHDPVGFLREAGRLLADGGSIVIAVPNAAGWQARHFGVNWFGLELPRHLFHFTLETLAACVEAAGLRVTGLRFARHADWLRSSAARAGGGVLRSKLLSRAITWLRSRGPGGDAILLRIGA